jgi:peptidoglycan hydrolase CwlO-like protein
MWFKLITLFSIFFFCANFALAVTPEERAQLEAELRQLEEESKKIQAELENKKGFRKGLEGELSLINAKISQSKNKIAQTQTTIKKIATDIKVKETKISTLDSRIERNKEFIAESLREIKKLDDVRAVIAFSSADGFDKVFRGFGEYTSIQKELANNVEGLRTNKKFVEIEKEELEDKKDETEVLRRKQEQDKREEEARQREKKEIISLTKQEEKDFEKVLAEKAKKAEAIKTRLFQFAGGSTAAIPFGTAVAHAELAQQNTGVPAAFVLAILTQESALGANVGRCYLTNSETGAGVNIKTGQTYTNVMKPTRDVPPFLEIVAATGGDPYKTPISCPIAGVAGWGGAMGDIVVGPPTKRVLQSLTAGRRGTI